MELCNNFKIYKHTRLLMILTWLDSDVLFLHMFSSFTEQEFMSILKSADFTDKAKLSEFLLAKFLKIRMDKHTAVPSLRWQTTSFYISYYVVDVIMYQLKKFRNLCLRFNYDSNS